MNFAPSRGANMGAQDFEPLRRSCGPTFVSPWLRRGSFCGPEYPQRRTGRPGRRICGPTLPLSVPSLAKTHEIPHRLIFSGPYIAIGVQDLEPLSEEKRQDAASTLICVNRRRPGRKSNSFKKKARRRPPSGFCWLSKSGDLEVYC
jgi:hypothetical protein